MHLKTLFASAVLATYAITQEIAVIFPFPNATVSVESSVTVQAQYQLYADVVDWVSVIVGLLPCPSTGCPASGPTDTPGLGTVLAQGAYVPLSGLRGNWHQNLTVTVPDGTPSGLALIGAAGFYASGASYVLAYANVTVNVAYITASETIHETKRRAIVSYPHTAHL